ASGAPAWKARAATVGIETKRSAVIGSLLLSTPTWPRANATPTRFRRRITLRREAAAELAGRHVLQRAELAIEVGEVAVADLVGDVADRPSAVDEEGTGLADAQFGDVVADRQPSVTAEEAVE